MKRFRALVAASVALSGTLLIGATAPGGVAQAATSDLFFSEYIEGSSFNKAIEIHNGTGTDIDLEEGVYSVAIYSNGSATASSTLNLTGTLANGDVWIGAHGSANATILALADETNSSVFNWNGDDAFALLKNGVLIDVIGQIGFDPGTNWSANGVATSEQTLVRKAEFCAGDPVGSDAFDPSIEWTGLPQNDVTSLGSHTSACDAPVEFRVTDPGDHTYFPGIEIEPIVLTASNGTPPYTFTAAPLPDGLSLAGATISGTPTTPGTTTVVVEATDSADPVATDQVEFDISVVVQPCPAAIDPISTVQGAGDTSPCVGETVTIEGVVVGDYEGPCLGTGIDQTCNLRGFYVQSRDADIDADPATSEGIFVFHGIEDAVDVGDEVRVTGPVAEFQGQTQLGFPDEIVELGTAQSVTPIVVALPMASPTEFEQYEGMLVTFEQTLFVTETFHMGRSGELRVSSGDRRDQPTAVVEPGPEAIEMQAENNLNYFIIDDAENTQNPDPYVYASGGGTLSAENTIRGGDTVTGATGVMTYTWAGFNATGNGNAYRLRPQSPAHTDDIAFVEANPRPAAAPEVGGSLKIVGFNVLNYFVSLDDGGNDCGVLSEPQECRGAETAEEYERQHDKLIAALLDIDADVYGFAELENTEVSPGVDVDVLAPIVDALNVEHGAGVWDYVDTGLMGTDTIRVGLIYRTDTVAVLGHAVMDSTTWPTFDDDNNRPTLAVSLEEIATGEVMNVAVNHWKSKGCGGATGADADQGDGAGCYNAARVNAAESLIDWMAAGPVGLTPDPDLLIFGDLNSYAKEAPIDVLLEDNDYVDLVQHFDPGAYSYVFDGQWGTLDYAIGSPSLFAQVTGAADYHINADEPPILDYNTNFKTLNNQAVLYAPDQFRTSDHDPAVVGVALDSVAPTVTVGKSAGQPDPAALRSDVVFTVTFSEPVTGFGLEDLSYSGGGVTPVISGSGADYTVTFSTVRRLGLITLAVGEGAATDAVGNTSEASTSIDNTVAVVPPGIAKKFA